MDPMGFKCPLDVSKNRGTPKMNAFIMGKPYSLMDDLGGNPPYFWKHPLLAWCFFGGLHFTRLPSLLRCQGDSDSTLRNHPGRSPGPQLHVGFVGFVVLLADVSW